MTIAPAFAMQTGDVLISGSVGVRVTRGSEVLGRAVLEPAAFALAVRDGRIVYQVPPQQIYPDFWPGTEPTGGPEVFIASPDGTVELLYVGGGSIRMFDVAEIPEVSSAPSVIAMRFDPLADGTHVESLLAIPVDGSAAHVVADVPDHVTGAAWLGDFFVISVVEEGGSSYLLPIDLNGQVPDWPLAPDLAVDGTTRVSTVARIGETSQIAYVLASGGFWEGMADLVIYDTETGATVATVDVGIPQMVVSAVHASDQQLAVSKVYDTHDQSAWSLIHVPITVYETEGWTIVPISIPGAGTYSVVG